MKKVLLLFTLSAAAIALAGCVKETDIVKVGPRFTIRATGEDIDPLAAGDATKASFTADGTTLRLAWQAGDQIRVFNHSNHKNNAVYDIEDGFTDHVAHFTGPEVSGSSFDVVAPGSFDDPDAPGAGVPDLTQEGNGSTAHLTFTAKLENVAKADLSDIVFNSEWASAHGATLKRGAIVKFVLTLPATITDPQWVTMTQFNGNSAGTTGILDNPISVNVKGADLGSDHVLTAYAQAGWDDIEFSNRNYFTIGVLDGDGNYYTWQHRITSGAVTLKAGMVNRIQTGSSATGTSGTDKWVERLFAGGDGTEGNPYLIASAKHLDNMHEDGILKSEERVYFRLVKDIDMKSYLESHTWLPLNSLSPYDKLIDFDGDGHTIDNFSCSFDATGIDDAAHHAASKPSFFGLLYGSCYDVNFTNAKITTNHGTAGIIGGYVGYSAKKAVVYNVHVQGSVIKTAGNGDTGVGGIAGRIVYTYMDSCSADVEVSAGNSQNYVGGLFGIDQGDASRVRNCWSAGSVTGSQRVGGICGGLLRPESQLINCFSTSDITCTYAMGGIAGHCNLDQASSVSPSTTYPDNVIKGCIAWQSALKVRNPSEGGSSHYSSGAIAGYISTHSYLSNCLRRADMTLQDYSSDYSIYDQNDADPDNPLVVNGSGKYNFPYHGKAFTGTLCAAAKYAGWDETVWDLSGSTPVLTGVVEAEPAAETPVSGQPQIESLNVNQGSLARPFPGTTTSLGTKSASQDGITWTVTDIASGIRYFHAEGKVSPSWMDNGTRNQELFVIDYDLSNTNYDVKIVHASPACALSQVFKATGAVAAINAGFEIGSIAVKANTQYTWEKADTEKENNVLNNIKSGSESVVHYPAGIPKSYAPNNTIGSTGVYNWKSEGAFYCDGHQGVRIAFDGYDGGATDKYGNNTKTKTIRQERLWYRMGTENEAGFMSSAPVLDANYVRFGMTFKERHPKESGEPSEGAYSHQTQTCPRTAVAIAYPDGDNGAPHLLLIVVDGRYADGYGGYGYSAYWLERHIANAFGPKYMLNLDGGGSTTMCVDGQGDGTTNVVNYPCDNAGNSGTTHNHSGQRARDTFICIIPRN